jgi:hypothetical protein
MTSYEEWLRASALQREEIDAFLSPDVPTWAQYDAELGYTLGNYMPRDGVDGSMTISTSTAHGARRAIIYQDRDCRLNTYGNSFTECHQVSDHETWQEYLAAHLGEPIRNFGMGGYGAFQSYRRMIRTEVSDLGTEYVLLYIWGDDHFRSIMRCRNVAIRGWYREKNHGARMFHGNFWANIEMDLQSGELVECESLTPTPQALYGMADEEFMVEMLRDDLMLQMTLYERGETSDVDVERLNQLAEWLNCSAIAEASDDMKQQVGALRTAYAFAATRQIIDKAAAFAERQNKKLMFILFCPRVMRQLISGERRYDREIVDYLQRQGHRVFDMNLVHEEDFKQFDLSLDQYVERYFIGHYSPAGNHFFAHSIKNPIVEWLDPKPITYRDDDAEAAIDFRGYLPES